MIFHLNGVEVHIDRKTGSKGKIYYGWYSGTGRDEYSFWGVAATLEEAFQCIRTDLADVKEEK